MQVDIYLKNAIFYDVVNRFDIVIGDKFSIYTDFTGNARWITENDPVLSVKSVGNNATAEATATGISTIFLAEGQLSDKSFNIIKELIITVVDAIINPATNLGLSSDPPIN